MSYLLLLLQVTCTFTITVVDSQTGALIPSASVTGKYSTNKSYSNWPLATMNASTGTGTSGSVLGQVAFQATKTLPANQGYSCTFTVSSITKTGYSMDPAMVKNGTLTNL